MSDLVASTKNARPSRWFGRKSQRSTWHGPLVGGVVAFVVTFAALAVWHSVTRVWNKPPSWSTDEGDYDSLGWELAHGRGYQIDRSNEAFLHPYGLEPSERGAVPTSYRPPMLPLVMAGLNRLLGRQFWGIRAVNTAAVAMAAGVVAGLATRLRGPLAGVLAVLQWVVVDWRIREMSRSLLTEALALLWVTLLLVGLIRLRQSPRISTALLTGLVLGMGILTRSVMALWTPLLVLFVAWRGGGLLRWRWSVGLTMGVSTALVLSPWMLFNVRRLGEFSPLGRQYQIESSAGFSDEAVERLGLWFNLEEAGFYPEDVLSGEGLERERRMARYSSARAGEWLWSHPGLALWLGGMKVLQEIRPWGIGELYVSLLAVAGWVAMRRTVAVSAGFCLLACFVVSVAVSWSSGGRFLFPMLGVLHVGAAVAAASLVESVVSHPVEE